MTRREFEVVQAAILPVLDLAFVGDKHEVAYLDLDVSG